MEENKLINSECYWDKRFVEDWEVNEGPEQSRFFAYLAIEHLPSWLFRSIKEYQLTVADWGCAQGDGTNALIRVIDPQLLTGVDFSAVAIEQARKRYPSIQFLKADWVDIHENEKNYTLDQWDIVFSSNTLEHFYSPFRVLDKLCLHAKQAVVLVLPYCEYNRIDEHHYSFFPENIPLELPNGFRLIWSNVVDCRLLVDTMWGGQQIFLVYGALSWLGSLRLRLSDCVIVQQEPETQVKKVLEAQHLETVKLKASNESHARIASLEQRLEESNSKITSLNQMLMERDESLAGFKKVLNEHEVELSKLKHTLEECGVQIVKLNEEINRYKGWCASISSFLLRKIKGVIKFMTMFNYFLAKKSYKLLRACFWRLPGGIRRWLNTPRHKFVRYVRFFSSLQYYAKSIKNNSQDMAWEDFRDIILAKRGDYKGVFIQEQVIDWNVPLFQRPQHISIALGKLGYLVIYKTSNLQRDDVSGFRQVFPNVWITDRDEVDQISAVRSYYSTAYAYTPKKVTSLRKGVLLYEYIDHIDPEISGDKETINQLTNLKNFAFNGGADYVIASSKRLYEEAVAAVGSNKVILVPNGVDATHYRGLSNNSIDVPKPLIEFDLRFKVKVGYFGALAPWLWYEVIEKLVNLRKDLGFIFIGPDYYGGAKRLPKSENVLWLGAVDYKLLPTYAQVFDVCLIPFKPGEIAKTTSPLKLFEYFALEKPVVVTSDMLECVQFPEVFKGSNVEELSLAVDSAIKVKDNSDFKKRLADLADQNDWNQRVVLMEKCFERLK